MAGNAIQKTDPQSVEVKSGQRTGGWTYRPNVDIFELPEELQLVAEVPGAREEQIEVAFEAGVLTIHARVAARHTEHQRSVLNEYGTGDFHRRFEIDDTIDTERVTADYNDGVLTVHLPKRQHARRHRVPVRAS